MTILLWLCLGDSSMANRVRWENLVTIFVDNLPEEMDAIWLCDIFSWCGVMKNSFIPSKRRSGTNSRFGFIRYKTIREARAAARDLNGVFCLYSKLFIKLADFGWKRSNERLGSFFHGDKEEGKYGGASNRLLVKATGRKLSIENASRKIIDNRSFADVVSGFKSRAKSTNVKIGTGCDPIVNATSSDTGIICADLVDEKWLEHCLVGKVGEVEHMESFFYLEDLLLQEGWADFSLRPLGGKKVLIIFQDDDFKRRFVSKSEFVMHKLFVKLENWIPQMVNTDRLVWLSIIGVPLHAWSEVNFRKIG
ncbi:hypothetical protein L1049_010989 [Liquidambar formosana]|uniref:RRM domain-containing protein n=1 Tax=Liquidambar formosana TaxID=63359 RepID=A0AAP0RQU3_LIQFO